MTVALGILAVIVLTLGTGYFVAQEFSFVSADRIELSRQAAAGDKNAASAIRVMERLSFMLSAAQVGITATGLLVGFIAEPTLAAAVRPLLEAAGLGPASVVGVSIAVGFVLATVLQMVVGELFPKNFALARAERLAKLLAPSTHVYLAVAGPVVSLFDRSSTWLLRTIGIEPVEELHHGATLEELGHIIDESQQHGALRRDLSGMLERALVFSTRTANEAMVPRPDVVSVRADATGARLLELIAESGHSHHPVVGIDTDDVVGVAGVRELMSVPADAVDSVRVGAIARPALFVPATTALPTLLRRMREHDEEFACVVDEYGGLAGIITLEDAAEELVGEIVDENDDDAAKVTRDGEWWYVAARQRTDETTERTGLALPSGPDYDTVGGMITAHLGRLAQPGERLVVTADPPDGRAVEIEVLSVDRHVPQQVRLRTVAPAAAGSTDEAGRS